MITPGIQQSLYVCSQILFEAKDEVWVEDPAYRGTTAILSILYKTFVWYVFLLMKKALRLKLALLSKHARAAFVTPSHQYPLGMPMSLARRVQLSLGKTAKCMDH